MIEDVELKSTYWECQTYMPIMQISQKVSQCSSQFPIYIWHLTENLSTYHYVACIIDAGNPKTQNISSIAILWTEKQNFKYPDATGAWFMLYLVVFHFISYKNDWPFGSFLLQSQFLGLQRYPEICSSLNPSHPVQIHVLWQWNMEPFLYQRKVAEHVVSKQILPVKKSTRCLISTCWHTSIWY